MLLRNKPIRRPGTTPMGFRGLSTMHGDDELLIVGDGGRAVFAKEKPRSGSSEKPRS